MECFIEYNGEKLYYTIEKTRRRSICIIVKNDAKIIVRAPLRMSIQKCEEFVLKKQKWIYEKYNEALSKKQELEVFTEDGFVRILGKKYNIKIIKTEKKRAKVYCDNSNLFFEFCDEYSKNLESSIEKYYYKYLVEIAEKEFMESIDRISKMVGYKPLQVKIRNFKRAWGNCSNKKVISLNIDLCKYSKKAIDYVCLHEICHLKYMNHSKDFWNMVEKFMPDYKMAEMELK